MMRARPGPLAAPACLKWALASSSRCDPHPAAQQLQQHEWRRQARLCCPAAVCTGHGAQAGQPSMESFYKCGCLMLYFGGSGQDLAGLWACDARGNVGSTGWEQQATGAECSNATQSARQLGQHHSQRQRSISPGLTRTARQRLPAAPRGLSGYGCRPRPAPQCQNTA